MERLYNKIYNDFKSYKINKVMQSLEKLSLLNWPARLQDWKNNL